MFTAKVAVLICLPTFALLGFLIAICFIAFIHISKNDAHGNDNEEAQIGGKNVNINSYYIYVFVR